MAETDKKNSVLDCSDCFPEDTTDMEDIDDEFNLTATQAMGESEEVPPEDVDLSVSRDIITAFTGTPENYPMNEATYNQMNQIDEAMQEKEAFSAENIVETKDIKVEREFTEAEKEKQERGKKAIINGKEIIKECFDEAVQTEINTGLGAKKIRSYKNEAKYPKSKYAKAKDGENPAKKYLFMAIACIAVGIFGGVYANSYYVFMGNPNLSSLNCAFEWLTIFDTLPVAMSPFAPSAFFAGAGIWAGILAVIFLFSVLNTEQLKNSRVGHEHGNAKIMNVNSFKKYKNRFMER